MSRELARDTCSLAISCVWSTYLLPNIGPGNLQGPASCLESESGPHTKAPLTPSSRTPTPRSATRARAAGASDWKMLDAFEILTTSGIVLWRKGYAPVSSHIINSLINDVFIEERGAAKDGAPAPAYRKEAYTLKWTSAKDVGLIFVVGKSRRTPTFIGRDGG